MVIGGGYIGLAAADALRRNGITVTLLEAGNCFLHRDDAELSGRLAEHLRRFGVDARLGARVRSIEADSVDGIPCDLVLIGLRPNAEIAFEAGVERGRTGAIHVDERMQTNLGGVYAPAIAPRPRIW